MRSIVIIVFFWIEVHNFVMYVCLMELWTKLISPLLFQIKNVR